MEIESLSSTKFGIVECGPLQDGCPSDGMSSDATVLCIDSDAEDETQSQDGIVPGLESRLQEKGLQDGPEPAIMSKPATLVRNGPGSTKGFWAGNASTVSGGLVKVFGKASDIGENKNVASNGANGRVSWGREQELAELAAAAQRAVCSKETRMIGSPGVVLVQNRCTDETVNQRKKKGSKNRNNATAWNATDNLPENDKFDENKNATVPFAQVPVTQLNQQRGRRRGRRGGRGRKQVVTDRLLAVPKLDKNLEEELAEQLANQASNDSALSMGFSSIRLHVPGGNTMIILNDHELKDGTTPDDILCRIENNYAVQEEKSTRNSTNSEPKRSGARNSDETTYAGAAETADPVVRACHQKTPSKGCGAFFPPSLLKTLNDVPPTTSKPLRRQTHRRTYTGNADCSPSNQKLNVGASPFMPFSSFSISDYRSTGPQSFAVGEKETCQLQDGSSEQALLVQRSRSGTGCFIPMYSQEAIIQEEPSPNVPAGHATRASLADSLSSIEDVSFSLRRNRLRFQPPEAEKVSEQEEEIARESNNGSADESLCETREQSSNPLARNNVGCFEGEYGLVVVGELSPAEEPDNPGDELMQLLEGNNFTSFTSALHLEETLEGLEEERAARINAEGRVVLLESENEELREKARRIVVLQEDLSKVQGLVNTLQVLLFVVLARPDKIRLGVIPRGMFRHGSQLDASELAAVRSKLASESAELMDIQKELEKKNAELKALSECWLCGTRGKKLTARNSSKTSKGKKEMPRTLPSGTAGSRTSVVRARSASSSDLKLAPTKASHNRTMSSNTLGLSKPTVPKGLSARELSRRFAGVKSKVTEVTKTTTTTKRVAVNEELTEETTTTEERKSVKKVVLPYSSVVEMKREPVKRLWR